MGRDRRGLKFCGDIDGSHTCGRVSVAINGFGGAMMMVNGYSFFGKCNVVFVVAKLSQRQ